MSPRFRLLSGFFLAVGLLQFSPGGTSLAGASTGGRSGQVQMPKGTIVDSRFVKTFRLDEGIFTVSPATRAAPIRDRGSVTTEMWATEEVGGYRAIAVGFGTVTITRSVRGVPKVSHLRAWVGLVHAGASFCTAMTTVPKPPRLPSDGWAAVVIGDAPGSPDVVYQAKTFRCATLYPPSVQGALEVLSVPWTLTSHGVVAKIPYCGVITGRAESGPAGSPAFTLRIDVAVPEDTRAVQLGPLPIRCPAARRSQVDVAASVKTLHAATGAEPMVTTS